MIFTQILKHTIRSTNITLGDCISDEYSPLWRQRTLAYFHPQHYGYFYAHAGDQFTTHTAFKGGNCIINIKEQQCRNL